MKTYLKKSNRPLPCLLMLLHRGDNQPPEVFWEQAVSGTMMGRETCCLLMDQGARALAKGAIPNTCDGERKLPEGLCVRFYDSIGISLAAAPMLCSSDPPHATEGSQTQDARRALIQAQLP